MPAGEPRAGSPPSSPPCCGTPTLPREIDPRAIDAYLALQYVPDPLCVLKGIAKLPAARTLEIDSEGERTTRYWELDYTRKHEGVSEDEAVEQIRDLVDEATRIRLMSEVPLGAFLSGGIDSSAVVASMALQTSEPVKTFSIGFDDARYDETRFARLVAERYATDHFEFRVRAERDLDPAQARPAVRRAVRRPCGDPHLLPLGADPAARDRCPER